MAETGERLKALREKAGLDPESIADQIGVSVAWYEDLEREEGELEDSLDLDQIRKLALVLSVGMAQLLMGAPVPAGTIPLSFQELAQRIRRHLEVTPGLDDLEKQTGWDLSAFLRKPEAEGWGQRAAFFRDVCAALSLDWLGVLAYCESFLSE